jgi:hypothetical protein
MPVEGQRSRPLGRRDRLVIAAVAAGATIAVGLGAWYATSGSSDSSNTGCVDVTLPASLGGETLRRCGSEAVSFCRAEGPRNHRIADACRRAGLGRLTR